jgi:nucleotide-binding universal stress UspA family protein
MKQKGGEMKKILVPVDFSESAKIASEAATIIAEKTGAEIHFLHVAEEVVAGEESNNFKEKLKKFASELSAVKAKTFVTDGVPYDDIVSHAEEHNIDLIIVCSEGISGYHGSYTTGNILRIIRLATCPLLFIPKDFKFEELSNIIFVSDFTFEYDYREKVLASCCKLKELTTEFQPQVDLLFIDTENCNEEKIMSCMEEFGKECDLQNIGFEIEKAESVDEGTLTFAKKKKADLIAMIGHGSGSYYTQLRTSISEKIIDSSEIPVMIFRLEK